MTKRGWHHKFVSALLIIILPGLLVTLGLARLSPPRPAPLPVLGAVTDFHLTSHLGKPIGLSDLKGFVWVADFFFSSCAGTCPKMKAQMKRVQQAFAQEVDLKLVSFTVDPETDTVPWLADYSEMWITTKNKWFFVTGDKKAIYALARQGFKVTAQQGDGGDEDFIHSDRLILVDRTGHIRGYYGGTEKEAVDRLMKHARRLLRER
jgi:protein SCO1/2